MMTSIQQLQALTNMLAEQATLSRQLLKKLIQENEILKTTEKEVLDQVVEEKQKLIEQLENGMSSVNRFLTEKGLATEDEGLSGLLKRLPDNTPLHQQWTELQQLATECKSQNEVNGGIILLKQRHVRQAIDILKGNLAKGNTYDRQGETHNDSSSSSFTKA